MIIGKKVCIRPIEVEDIDVFYKWWNSGELMEHAGFPHGLMTSKEATRQNLMRTIESSEVYPDGRRFIICKIEDMKPIGEMNYTSWDKRNRSAEFGIKICEMEEQGKGFGEDALRHFIDYMFKHLNLNRIFLTTMPDNQRAHSLYKKLGFKFIGAERQAYFDSRTGKYTDVFLYDMLKGEWKGIE
jgi:RimJ/RimL family protein N-acetyltransferase